MHPSKRCLPNILRGGDVVATEPARPCHRCKTRLRLVDAVSSAAAQSYSRRCYAEGMEIASAAGRRLSASQRAGRALHKRRPSMAWRWLVESARGPAQDPAAVASLIWASCSSLAVRRPVQWPTQRQLRSRQLHARVKSPEWPPFIIVGISRLRRPCVRCEQGRSCSRQRSKSSSRPTPEVLESVRRHVHIGHEATGISCPAPALRSTRSLS